MKMQTINKNVNFYKKIQKYLTFDIFLIILVFVNTKNHIKSTETTEILNWLDLNGPAAADELAGHLLNASSKSASRMIQHLRKLRKAGLVEPVDAGERPMKWKTCRRALPPLKMLHFPVALTQLRQAA